MPEPLATGILAALVSITAPCAVVSSGESILIGGVGALVSLLLVEVVNWMQIDDPCAAAAIHGGGGIGPSWGPAASEWRRKASRKVSGRFIGAHGGAQGSGE